MNLKLRLIAMNFFQLFIWGSWLITIGAYWFQNKHWSASEFGAIFSTLGIASLFMPTLAGIVADRWIGAEKLYGLLHFAGAGMLLMVAQAESPRAMFWIMLVNSCFYMPTMALAAAISYNALKRGGFDVIRDFPPIRVWGTIGFIAALWTVSLLHLETSAGQFYLAAGAAATLGLYAFALPKCPPQRDAAAVERSWLDAFGLSAFALFKDAQMAVFFGFAVLLGAALQLANAYGDTYLHDFARVEAYRDLIAVRYPAIIMSLSQISETLFILTIPFFLRRFGMKVVMTMSLVAWFLRFSLFAYGNPGDGLWMILLSCIVYGMAFDFFNISGSLFVEQRVDAGIRASTQGLLMLMTNGIGAMLGSWISGVLIDRFFILADGAKDWHGIWLSFAIYAIAVAVLFVLLFRYRHDAVDLKAAGLRPH